MNELRNTISTTAVPRTGTLTVEQVIDLAELAKEHGEAIPVDVLREAGLFEVVHTIGGKSKRIALRLTRDSACGFVSGFVACAVARKRRAKKAAPK